MKPSIRLLRFRLIPSTFFLVLQCWKFRKTILNFNPECFTIISVTRSGAFGLFQLPAASTSTAADVVRLPTTPVPNSMCLSPNSLSLNKKQSRPTFTGHQVSSLHIFCSVFFRYFYNRIFKHFKRLVFISTSTNTSYFRLCKNFWNLFWIPKYLTDELSAFCIPF